MRRPAAWRGRAPGRRTATVVVSVLVAAAFSACASTGGRRPTPDRSSESLGNYVSRVRALASEARPRKTPIVPTVETWDPRLAAATLELATQMPTAELHRRVALEYRRLGILDMAHTHFSAAVRLDDQDAAAFDGLARIWRDWGFPHLGLADAYRAVHIAPKSAPAANTLGTLLQAEGRTRDASQWYERAVALDPTAAYAVNNLCYASIMMRDARAVGTCERAVNLAPDSKQAHNNLALAYAAAGNFDRARREFEASNNAVAAQYNLGLLYLADRQFDKAAAAFDAALVLDPRYEQAAKRARQTRGVAAAGE